MGTLGSRYLHDILSRLTHSSIGPDCSATAYEFILFGFASYQALKPATRGVKLSRASLRSILINDNILYFFGSVDLLKSSFQADEHVLKASLVC